MRDGYWLLHPISVQETGAKRAAAPFGSALKANPAHQIGNYRSRA
jgi:hypothetical protein